MDDRRSPDTRARILETALDLFSERGYQASSMREIAARLDITKATVFYHFPSKAMLLATLCEPLTEDFEDLLGTAAEVEDPVGMRRVLIEGTLDAYIRNRRVLRLLLHDLTLLAHDHAFRELVSLVRRIHELFAGPEQDVSARIRAVQIFAMLSDPVFFFEELPIERLRAEILAGVWALLDEPTASGLVTREEAGLEGGGAGPAPRRAGRPSVMDAGKAAAARRMYATGSYSVNAIAERLGVSRATVYRHLREDAAPPPP
ncbi:TetR family transcriptional regulator [Actinomadura rugatobispora]|uniref:TetR family transcriptional regulator n=1 Tax=Actinomadura rugatobispora TaxID=1994 RepID=A0ABW1AJP3_9ACTN|nr:TetR family transcriptional regulator [Actinomadura rugatobispora]